MTRRPPPEPSEATRPDISFVVAAHCVAPFIEAAIRSALNQPGCRVEVVVVDDHSTDDTASIVARMAAADPRVRLLRRSTNGGPSAARNAALETVRGDWVAVLDGDDMVLPERGRRLLDLAAITSADLVADNIVRFGHAPEGQPEASALPQGGEPYSFVVDPASYVLANRVFGPGPNLGYLKPMFRRAFLVSHGIGYDPSLRIAEDYRICLDAMLAGGRYVVTSAAHYRYRVREGSLSWRLKTADLEAMAKAHARVDWAGAAAWAGMRQAAALYRSALDRALVINRVADAAATGAWLKACGAALRRPDAWGYFLRIVLARVKLRLRRPVRTPERARA